MIKFDFQNLKTSAVISLTPEFPFKEIQPNMPVIANLKKYQQIKNVIVIGRGGSISTFRAFWEGYGQYQYDRKVFLIDTVDPDFIDWVRKQASIENSLVVAVSKSGNTVDVIENLMCFPGYKTIAITENKEPNDLLGLAKKTGFEVIFHPELGGRYSGLTEPALVPAAICGLNIEEMLRGGREAYQKFTVPGNEVEKLAQIIKEYSDQGYTEIFWPIYSKKLAVFSELIMQLIHESVGKDGKGITVLPVEAPESQHHTNQRFFGGPKNMFAIFTTVGSDSGLKIDVPAELADTSVNSFSLGQIDGISVAETMRFEFVGTYTEAKNLAIPAVWLELEKVNEYHLGYFTAFLHCFAAYLATAFGVNPYDQPHVEGSKKISISLRSKYQKTK